MGLADLLKVKLMDFLRELPKKKLPEDIKSRLDKLIYNCSLKSSHENIGELERELKGLSDYKTADYMILLEYYRQKAKTQEEYSQEVRRAAGR